VKESTLSRRLSEFVGVVLFALGLIWLISLVSHEPSDPVWFFTTGSGHAPANFVGRVGAFLSELSFQLFGYAAYLIPAVIAIAGWHYFWCQKPDAAYTKVTGAALLFVCTGAFLSLVFDSSAVRGKSFHAGGSIGSWFAEVLARFPGLGFLRGFTIRHATTLLFILVVGLVFYFVPNAKVRFRDVWVGAFLTGLLWKGALEAFAWYMRDMSRFTRVNGSIGAVVVFLVWVYIQAVILLYGVEFTAAYARLRRGRPEDVPAAATPRT